MTTIETRRQVVGTSVLPDEARPLLLGEGQFAADVQLPHTLHLAFLRSPHPHARIRSIDVSGALAVPGVVAVLTGQDLLGQVEPFRSVENRYAATPATVQHWLAVDKVRYVGEPVCAVIARDRATAEDACELIDVDYELLPAVTDVHAALEPEAPLVHQEAGRNVFIDREYEAGDVEGAFRSAHLVVRRRFRLHRKTALCLETRGCTAAYREGGWTLTVWLNNQHPHIVRYLLAKHLGLQEHEVRVIITDTGGGFGQKSTAYPEEFVVAYAALRLRRPVKWVEDRLEHMLASTHARDQHIDVEAAFDKEGRILGLRAQVISDCGAYSITPWTAGIEPLQTAGLMPGPYRVPAQRYRAMAVATNKTPGGPYRAVGRPSAVAALELVLDEAARQLGMDPVDIRLINLIREEETPYRNINRLVHEHIAYRRCLETLLEKADYEALRETRREARERGKLRGIGVICYAELTGLGTRIPLSPGIPMRMGRDAVTLRLEPTGVLTVAASMPSQGQRIATAMRQVAADALGIPVDRIRVVLNDTAVVPFGFGVGASRTAVVGSGAVIRAARELKERILACAAHLMEVAPEELEIVDGVVRHRQGGRELPLEQVAYISYFEGHRLPSEVNQGLEVTAYYDPIFGSFSGAAHLAVVDIDTRTGRPEVVRYVAVEDCGRVINPAVVKGQVTGGVAQGLGEALMEELVYGEDGQLYTGTLMDYLVPTAPDVPNIEVYHVEQPSSAEGGFKGVGEGAHSGALAAICCAVVDALKQAGADLTEFPATPDRIWEALTRGGDEGQP